MLKISLLTVLLLDFIQGMGNSVTINNKEISNLSIDFNQLFIKSANSKDYYVIHENDLKQLSLSMDYLIDSTRSLITTLHEKNESINFSYLASIQKADSLEQIVKESIKEKQSYSVEVQFIKKWSPLILLSLLSVFLALNYLKIKVKYKEDVKALEEIENQFTVYKRNAIERERKLVREIIDLKKEI